MTRFQHILVATDGSPTGERATEIAIDLASCLGARLTVVSVGPALATDADLDSATDPLGAAEEAAMALRRQDPDRPVATAADHARASAERARIAGINATWSAWQGPTGDAILAATEHEGVELVVVGTHARAGVDRLLRGSVSDHVVRQAPVPVLVVGPERKPPT